jgi:N-acetylmuramoyl-L-alanine amidase
MFLAGPAAFAAGPLLYIDPGHGRGDSGVQAGASNEADIAFDVATRLQALLKAQGLECLLSHDASQNPSAAERAAAANASGASAFLSLHLNHSPAPSVRGPRIFIPKPLPAPAAGEASRWDKAAGQKSEEAKALALELAKSLGTSEGAKTGVQSLNLVAFKGLAVPGVLVELGFLSHAESRERFAGADYRQAEAQRLADGVLAWAKPAAPSAAAP